MGPSPWDWTGEWDDPLLSDFDRGGGWTPPLGFGQGEKRPISDKDTLPG